MKRRPAKAGRGGKELNLTRIVYPGPGKGQENIWNSLPERIKDSEGRFYMRFSGNFPAPEERYGSSLDMTPGEFYRRLFVLQWLK
jgi:hypothetical protein